MTAYLRNGYHVFECNQWTAGKRCENVHRFDADSYSIASAVAALPGRGWRVFEPIIPDGGIHVCPEHPSHR